MRVEEAHRRLAAGDLPGAEAGFRAVLAQNPHDPAALSGLGIVAGQCGRLDQAVALLRRAAHGARTDPDHWARLAAALAELGAYAEMETAARRAVALDPGHINGLRQLGCALIYAGDIDRARQMVDRAMAAGGDPAELAAAAGAAALGSGNRVLAENLYRAAIGERPGFAEAHVNLSLLLLGRGAWPEGFAHMAYRRRPALAPDGPAWDGKIRPGQRLLVWADQGYGDSLQFGRYMMDLAAAGMQIVFQCRAELVALFQAQPWIETAFAHEDRAPAYAVQTSLFDLPRFAGTTPQTVPHRLMSLRAPDRPMKLAPRTPKRLRVGLCWESTSGHDRAVHKSMPFDALRPVFDLPNVEWVSLQFGTPTTGLEVLREGVMVDGRDLAADFADTAALLWEVDVIVSVNTALAHLAGSLGRPVIVALHADPDWRWRPQHPECLWYASAHLLYQKTLGDWKPVATEIAGLLAAWPR